MSLSRPEATQLLERLIFEEMAPQDWTEDVWGLSPIHGDSATKLLEVFYSLLESCSEEKLENMVQSLYQEKMSSQSIS